MPRPRPACRTTTASRPCCRWRSPVPAGCWRCWFSACATAGSPMAPRLRHSWSRRDSSCIRASTRCARAGHSCRRWRKPPPVSLNSASSVAKEQYLLELERPSFNFGHARWREKEAEAADAAAWFAASPGRALLVDEKTLALCFAGTQSQALGRANRQHWFLVTGGAADDGCVTRGDLRRARLYIPPNASINSAR